LNTAVSFLQTMHQPAEKSRRRREPSPHHPDREIWLRSVGSTKE